MSQSSHTPAWGTPITTGGQATPPATSVAETQVLPPVSPVRGPSDAALPPRGPAGPSRPTREMVELRVTALHYANRLMGERGTAAPDTHTSATLRVAKQLERYLLTGDTSAI